jgi:hypothetical protein
VFKKKICTCTDIEHPEENDTIHGSSIGKDPKVIYTWLLCKICGKGRWVKKTRKPHACKRCQSPANGRHLIIPIPIGSPSEPELNDIRFGKEIGKPLGSALSRYRWQACPHCGKTRWVQYSPSRPQDMTRPCTQCRAYLHKTKDKRGYVYIKLKKEDFFYSMTDNRGYVLEHRLVMAQSLGRCLQKWEVIHHKNGIKSDNQLSNLELVSSNNQHIVDHSKGYRDGYSKGYDDGTHKKIVELQEEVKILQQELADATTMAS